MKKKLAIIAPRFPYPLEKGDKLRMFHQIRSLSEAFDIFLFALSDIEVSKTDLEQVHVFCKEIHIYPINGKLNLLSSIWNGLPFQSSYYYSRKVHKGIQEQIDRIEPHHIFYQLIRTAKYKVEASTKHTMDLMDCFSKGYDLRAQEERGVLSFLYGWEARKLKKQEQKCIQEFDQLTVISEQDARSMGVLDRCEIISNGIDAAYFSSMNMEKENDVVFIGNLGYEPNIYAVEFLKREIFPLVKSTRNDVRFSIAGARPSKRVTSLKSDQFEIQGWVEDIRTAYDSSKIFVAPIFGGIGQQNKVLEAMAMNIPCIVSKAVAHGLGLEYVEQYIYVAETPQEYAELIVNILDGTEDTSSRQANALGYVREKRSWKGVNEQLISILQEE